MKLRLKDFREARHMSQKDLADKIGMSYRSIQQWERGDTFPNASALCVLCTVLGCEPNDLLGWYDEHPEDRPSASVTRDEAALVDNYRACSHDRRMMVSGYARDQCELSRQQEAPYTSPSLGNESLAETAARLGGAARVAKVSRMEFEDRAV